MSEWEFSVYHLARELGMLAEDVMQNMSSQEFMRWGLYFSKLADSKEDGKPNNLLSGSVDGLIGALT